MSADDNLSPRQFGPNGKYTTTPHDLFDHPATNPGNVWSIRATHTDSGRTIGALSFGHKEIGKVVVSKPLRRKGVATAMLEHARAIRPDLQHSNSLTEDGKQWARKRP